MKTALVSLLALSLSPAAMAADIQIGYSAEFQQKLQDEYGVREGERLAGDLRKDLERELKKANTDAARIVVTINDAKPNRPTMEQLTDQPGLDMLRSKSIGGMDMSGVAYDVSGNAVAELDYDWFETSIENVRVSGVWSDANRASRRFAREFAEEIAN